LAHRAKQEIVKMYAAEQPDHGHRRLLRARSARDQTAARAHSSGRTTAEIFWDVAVKHALVRDNGSISRSFSVIVVQQLAAILFAG
jgi:hypothetical protein